MKPHLSRFRLGLTAVAFSLLLPEEPAYAQSSPGKGSSADVRFTTSEYRETVLELVLQEANHYADRLGLSENLPIQREHLIESRPGTPWMQQQFGLLGSIRTSNYFYGVVKDNRLVYITGRSAAQRYDAAHKQQHVRPWSELNTNAAYQLATQWLARAYVDVARLEKECLRTVEPIEFGDGMVPNYSVRWMRGDDTVVQLQLFEPDRLLNSMHIEDPSFVLRPRIVVPNRQQPLQKTDPAPSTPAFPLLQRP
jgi:hypothetical protein